MAVQADAHHPLKRGDSLVAVLLRFLRQILAELAQAFVPARPLCQLAGALVFDNQVAVQGVLDSAKSGCVVAVLFRACTRYVREVGAK